MFEEVVSLLSLYSSMSSWLTPSFLFLVLNLMIVTIAVTSGFSHKPPPPQQQPLHHHHHQLSPAPSVLHRLKSLNLYSYIHSHHNHPQPPPPQPPSAPAVDPVLAAIPTEVIAPPAVEKVVAPPEIVAPAVEEEVPETEEMGDGPTMDEVYNLIIKKGNSGHYGRQNSDTKPAGGEILEKLPRKIKKSASDKSAFGHFEAVEERENALVAAVEEEEDRETVVAAAAAVAVGGGGVDERADDFINKFREQLKMQRMESIVRYKEMITRGSEK